MSTTTLIVGLVVAIVMVWMAYIIIDQAKELRALDRHVSILLRTIKMRDAAELARSKSRHPSQRRVDWPARESEIEE